MCKQISHQNKRSAYHRTTFDGYDRIQVVEIAKKQQRKYPIHIAVIL